MEYASAVAAELTYKELRLSVVDDEAVFGTLVSLNECLRNLRGLVEVVLDFSVVEAHELSSFQSLVFVEEVKQHIVKLHK